MTNNRLEFVDDSLIMPLVVDSPCASYLVHNIYMLKKQKVVCVHTYKRTSILKRTLLFIRAITSLHMSHVVGVYFCFQDQRHLFNYLLQWTQWCCLTNSLWLDVKDLKGSMFWPIYIISTRCCTIFLSILLYQHIWSFTNTLSFVKGNNSNIVYYDIVDQE